MQEIIRQVALLDFRKSRILCHGPLLVNTLFTFHVLSSLSTLVGTVHILDTTYWSVNES